LSSLLREAEARFILGKHIALLGHHLLSAVHGQPKAWLLPSSSYDIKNHFELLSTVMSKSDQDKLSTSIYFLIKAVFERCETTEKRAKAAQAIASISNEDADNRNLVTDIYWSAVCVAAERSWALDDIRPLITPTLLKLTIPNSFRWRVKLNLQKTIRDLEKVTRDFDSHPSRYLDYFESKKTKCDEAFAIRDSVLLALDGKFEKLKSRYAEISRAANLFICDIAINSGISNHTKEWLKSRTESGQLNALDLSQYLHSLREGNQRLSEAELLEIKKYVKEFEDPKLFQSAFRYVSSTGFDVSWGLELTSIVIENGWVQDHWSVNSVLKWLIDRGYTSQLENFLGSPEITRWIDMRSAAWLEDISQSKKIITEPLRLILNNALTNPESHDLGIVWMALGQSRWTREDIEDYFGKHSSVAQWNIPSRFQGVESRSDYLDELCRLSLVNPKTLNFVSPTFEFDEVFNATAITLAQFEADYSAHLVLDAIKERVPEFDWNIILKSVIKYFLPRAKTDQVSDNFMSYLVSEVTSLGIQLTIAELQRVIEWLAVGGSQEHREALFRKIVNSEQRNMSISLSFALPNTALKPNNHASQFETIARESGLLISTTAEGRLANLEYRTGRHFQRTPFAGPDASTWSSMRVILDDVIHEINQPLAALSNRLVGVSRRLGTIGIEKDSDVLDALAAMKRSLELIEDRMKDYRGLTAGGFGGGFFEITGSVREALSSISQAAKDQNVTLEINTGQLRETYYLRGDPFFFKQMLRNLVKNALNALKLVNRKGKIAVNLSIPSRFEQDILITISDNGPGIPEELRADIYKRGITSKPGHGLGLGLSLASSVAQSLGGSLRLRTTDSSGTTFVIDLPVTTTPEEMESVEDFNEVENASDGYGTVEQKVNDRNVKGKQ